MSKTFRPFIPVFAAILQILHFFTNGYGQQINAKIAVEPKSGQIVTVSGRNPIKQRNLSFRLSAAGTDDLGARVSRVKLFDEDGKAVAYKRFIPGEYVAETDFSSWNYTVDLTPPKRPSAAAHVSWISVKRGVLMLDDILPLLAGKEKKLPAKISLDLPKGWSAYSDGQVAKGNDFETDDVERAVIYIGDALTGMEVATTGTKIRMVTDGTWNFDTAEAKQIAREICEYYGTAFGTFPQRQVYIGLMKYPVNTSPGEWEAETRGMSITIISSDMPFKNQSIQRLHEQLRHEMFHLWIPNGIELSGNYDWFYEGFALYQSLKLGVAVNRIRFDDFLDTLSRAYEIDRTRPPKLSLIDAARDRWSGSNTYIYARGMLVAFLCDLAMLERSKGKLSVTDLLRELCEHNGPTQLSSDGNTAVLAMLRKHAELVPVIDRNITGTDAIDWSVLLHDAGLDIGDADKAGHFTKLGVTPKPSGRQKDLLDKLGYNNWRKLRSKQ